MSLGHENIQMLLEQHRADEEVRSVMNAIENCVRGNGNVNRTQATGTVHHQPVPATLVNQSFGHMTTSSPEIPTTVQIPTTTVHHLTSTASSQLPTISQPSHLPIISQPSTISQILQQAVSQPLSSSVQALPLPSTSGTVVHGNGAEITIETSDLPSTSNTVESGQERGVEQTPARTSQRLLRNPVPKGKFGNVKQAPDYRQDEEFCTKVQVELFCCNFCLVCFETMEEIKLHLHELPEHKTPRKPKEKPFPCKNCGKSFVSSMTLNRHMRKMHRKPVVRKPRKPKAEKNEEEGEEEKTEEMEAEESNNLVTEELDDSADDEDYVISSTRSRRSGRKTYKCADCGSGYPTIAKLKSHMETHAGKAEFECDICHELYRTQLLLKQHQKTTHGIDRKTSGRGVPSLECDMCEYVALNMNAFRIHLESHKDQEIKCRICDRTAVDFRRLRKHFRQQHRPGKKWRVCEICGHKSSGPSSLELHMATHTGARKYKCDTCGLRFVRKYAMERHNEVKHLQIRRYMCTICGQKFGTNFALQKHEEYHADEKEKKHFCPTCKEGFVRENVMKWHVQYYHGSAPKVVLGKRLPFDRNRGPVPGMDHTRRDLPYPCELCKRTFSSHAVRERHVRAFHSDDTSLLCKICGVRFGAQVKYDQHVASHNGMTSHRCRFCPKTFKRDHLRQVHESEKHTGARPWKCTCCEERFISKARMYAHRLIHYGREIKCDICDRNFASLPLKKRHMRKHTGVKEFQCELCNKEYKQKSNYTAHMKLHTGLGSIQCDHCEQRFVDLGALRKHLPLHKEQQQQQQQHQDQQQQQQHDQLLQVLQQHDLQPVVQQVQVQHQGQPLTQQTVQIIPYSQSAHLTQSGQQIQIIETDDHHHHHQQHQHLQIIEQQQQHLQQEIIRGPTIMQPQGTSIQQLTQLSHNGESIDLVAYNCDVCGQMFLSTEALINHCHTHVMAVEAHGHRPQGQRQQSQISLYGVVTEDVATATHQYYQ